MITENLKQVEIAKKLEISPQHLNDILRGRKSPSPKLAAKLETVTGVGRFHWLYPDEYPNPFIKKAKK